MKILVVDDEPLARERLLRLLKTLEPEAEVAEASNGEQALELVALQHPDLLLLDVRMPGMDGLAVASELQKLEQPPAVIFCTAYDHYALEALDNQAAAYLLKPVREEKLAAAMQRAGKVNRVQLASLQSESGLRSHIVSESSKGVERVAVNDIRCFIAEQKYVRVLHPGGSVLIPDTLKDLELEFSNQFLRAHRNSLVARQHIVGLRRDGVEGWLVELDSVEEKPSVSRRHLSDLKEQLS
jgi:two-component system, LytTR family, response regulator AlgR